MTGGTAVAALLGETTTYVQSFITDWGALLAIPIGILSFGMIVSVVVGAIRKG